MLNLQRKDSIYYCYKKTNSGFKKYIQAKTIDFYDRKGRIIKELDYYRWKRNLDLSAIRIYEYKKDKLVYEETSQLKANITEKKYHIYNDHKIIKSINIEFLGSRQNQSIRATMTDYLYDRYGRLIKDVMNFGAQNFSETYYFYAGQGKKIVKKIEISHLGKGNRWCTKHYYDDKGRIVKEYRICKKGPLADSSFRKYYYGRGQDIIISSNGEKILTKKTGSISTTKWYTSSGELTRYVIMRECKDGYVTSCWDYKCDCNGIVEIPIFQSITKCSK